MKKFYCTGVTPFLNLCAADILPKNSDITYLINIEKPNSESSKRELKDMEFKQTYVKDIALFFKYQVSFKNLSDVNIKNDDIVTSNLLRCLLPKLRGQELIIFPEGSSCFNSIFKRNIFQNFYRNIIFNLKKIIGSYKIKKYYILPCRDIKLNISTQKKNNFIFIDKKIFFLNIKKCSIFFYKKYNQLNLTNKKKLIFHPLNEHLDLDLYKKWVQDFKKIIGEKKLLIKSHENDYRDYSKIFRDLNYIEVPKKFITLPAELIIDNFDAEYIGYYSSTMLHFKKKDINILTPPDKNLIKTCNKEFFGLKSLMKI